MKATTLSDDIVKKFLYYLVRIRWRKAYAFVRGQIGFMKLHKYIRAKFTLGKLIFSIRILPLTSMTSNDNSITISHAEASSSI